MVTNIKKSGIHVRLRNVWLLKTTLHMLNEGDGVEEFTLALRTLLNPPFVTIVFALLDTVNVVLKWRHDLRSISIARKLAFTSSTVNPSIKLRVIDDCQENRVRHPFWFLGQHCPLVRWSTRVLVNTQTLFVQKLETTNLTLFDETCKETDVRTM